MVHVGLDLSRTRLDVHVMDEAEAPLAVTTALPDAGGLDHHLPRRTGAVERIGEHPPGVAVAAKPRLPSGAGPFLQHRIAQVIPAQARAVG